MRRTRSNWKAPSTGDILRGLWWRILLVLILAGLWLALAVMYAQAGQAYGQAGRAAAAGVERQGWVREGQVGRPAHDEKLDVGFQGRSGQFDEVTRSLPVLLEGPFGSLEVRYQGGEYGFVADLRGAVTLFQAAWDDGSLGFLAHNYLAGAAFYELRAGNLLRVTAADGSSRWYVVRETMVFTAIDPGKWWTDVIDEEGRRWSQEEVYAGLYERQGWVVLQTCWGEGRYAGWWFAVAEPVELISVWLCVVWN